MRGERSLWLSLAATALAGLGVAGCGGGDERQDANEPEGRFRVEVVGSEFPARQRLASQEELVVRVRNAGDKKIPNVAVTIGDSKGQRSFGRASQQSGLADPERPVWIVDRAPEGGATSYVNTWALGSLDPGEVEEFRWRVTPVRSGTYTVQYAVAAGLDGKAKAVGANGQAPGGTFNVRVSGRPSDARIAEDGKTVIRE